MFDTCTAANRIIDQPLLTTFNMEYFNSYSIVDPIQGTVVYKAVIKYTRIRRASYKYVGCTHAAALTKANELKTLFNREVMNSYSRQSVGMWSDGVKNYKRAADVKIVLEHDIAYNVEVSLDEELIRWYNDTDTSPGRWTAFENNPDLATDLFKFGGTGYGPDFEYDGILPSS